MRAWLPALLSLGGCDPALPAQRAQCPGWLATDALRPPEPARALAVGSNYGDGALFALDARLGRSERLAVPVTGDAVLRTVGSALVVLNRAQGAGDNLDFFDLRGALPRRLCQVPVITEEERRAGGASQPYGNAHDLLVVDGRRAYIARWNLPSLAVLDLGTGAIVRTVDLSPWRGRARLPNPDALALVGDEVWVTLERLDDPAHPTQPGLIVRVDPRTDTVMGALTLPHANPLGPLWLSPDGREVRVATLGDYARADDGGVVAVERATGRARTLLSEGAVGGNIDGFVPLPGDRALLRVSGARRAGSALERNRVVAVDLGRAVVEGVWLSSDTWSPALPVVLGDTVLLPDPGGEDFEGAGVRLRDLQGRPLREGVLPLGAGMRPYDLRLAP
ncbi:MAG: hypothetical protein HY909_20495 [Deltaproteobacteria bacterium]|nr:hypothetical protein [Deltaproteobacteria bacterium]